MAVIVNTTVPVHSQTKIHTDGSTSSNIEEMLSFDMTIYRAMSSTEDMKTLEAPDRITTEFDQWVYLAEQKQNGISTPEFDAMDEYMASFVDNADVILPPAGTRKVVYNTINNVVDSGNAVVHVKG